MANKDSTLTGRIIFFLLCFTIVVTTIVYGTVHPPIIGFFYLIVTIVTLLWILDSFASGVLRFNRSLLQIPLLAAAAYAVVQIIPFGELAAVGGLEGITRTISKDPFWTQVYALHFFALFLIFAAYLTYIDSARRIRAMATLITIFGFLFAFFAILQAVLSPNKIYGIYEVAFAQPFGSFVNRHNFAAYMEMTIAVPLGLLFSGAVQKDKRLLYLTAIGLMGIALLMSGSRGGLVALLAQVVFLVFLTRSSHRQGSGTAVKAGLAFILLAVIVAGAVFIGGETSLTRLADTAGSQDFSTNRTHIWAVTLELIRHNLPFGAGFGAFGVAYTPFDTFNGIERVEQAHNDYLQVLADAGLVGLVIGAFFLWHLFGTGLKSVKTDNIYRRGVALGAFAGCFAVLVHSLFDFVLHTTAISVMFLTLASLVVVAGRRYSDDIDDFQRHSRRHRSASIASIEEARKTGR